MSELVEQKSIIEFAENAYLGYSMYVIRDRALPHIADGLKPVQRRIIYAMSELGLKASAKFKKSARTVGDVLGKFHPHGDSACYEAMVLMSQPFSYRYPLIDGQGNWGSTDNPKSFAAMRYTEARLSAYADLLLKELSQGTVDWTENFDGTLEEPVLLPACLPNILLNGASGIAVGMASDILPHNLNEVADACIYLLDNPNAKIDALFNFIKAPDFPSQAEIITPLTIIHKIYQTGTGSIKARATYKLEKQKIIINQLPYQTSGSKVIEQIALQMQQKKLLMIEDIRDESNHEQPIRIVIYLKSTRQDSQSLLLHLFATTDLEKNYRVNFNLIGLNNKPQVKNLLTILQEWISFRIITVTKRLQFRLNKTVRRLEIVNGLIIAYLNIDEVIKIIREEELSKTVLMQRFNLTELQVEAILEMKLRYLAKLEEVSLQAEQDELIKEKNLLEQWLASKIKLKNLIKKEIIADRKQFGEPRRSIIIERSEAQVLKEEAIIANETLTVILSQQGWVKALKGLEVLGDQISYKTGDSFKTQTPARSNQNVLFFDNVGKVYTLAAHTLPAGRSQGEPLSSRLNLSEEAHFETLIAGNSNDYIALASSAGYGFIAQMNRLYVKNKNGKACIKLPAESMILTPQLIEDKNQQFLATITNKGKLLIVKVSELPELNRGKGARIISLSLASLTEERLMAVSVFSLKDSLMIHAGKRHLVLKPEEWLTYQGKIGQKGKLLPRGLQNVHQIQVLSKN